MCFVMAKDIMTFFWRRKSLSWLCGGEGEEFNQNMMSSFVHRLVTTSKGDLTRAPGVTQDLLIRLDFNLHYAKSAADVKR